MKSSLDSDEDEIPMPNATYKIHEKCIFLSGKEHGYCLGVYTCNRLNLIEKWASMYITIKLFIFLVCAAGQ